MRTVETHLLTNWKRASLADVCEIASGYGFPESLQGRASGDIPFFKVADISEAWKGGEINLKKANHYISEQEAQSLKATSLPAATTVFAKIGPSIALNRRVMLAEPGLVDNNVMGLVPNQDVIDPLYLFYFSCTLRLDEISHPAKVPFIRKSAVGKIEIPLPPLTEQQRIVGAITAKLQRLDAAAAGLKAAHEALIRQRNAILEAACTGQLVAAEVEVAPLEERNHESSVGLTRIARPLPDGWSWIKLRDLGSDPNSVIRSGPYLRAQDFEESGVPVLNVGCVRWGEFDESKLDYLPEHKAADFKRYRIEPGDILFTRTGSTGRCAVATERQEGWLLTDHILRTRVDLQVCVPEFIGYAFERAAFGIEQQKFSSESTRAGLNKTVLASCEVPLPPYREQVRIVSEVETRMVHLKALQAVVRKSLERSKQLRQTILERAFQGKLLPHNSANPQSAVMGIEPTGTDQKVQFIRA
jgi:type I restriction enzyme S subunit